jgi:hypothetical protein
MGVIRQTAGVDSRKKSTRMPQEPFSRGGWPLWYPPFFVARFLNVGSERLKFFANAKTMWTLTSCGRQERAHRIWKSRQEREIPHSAHIDHLFLGKKNDEENHLRKLSTESDHPHAAGPKKMHRAFFPHMMGRSVKRSRAL